MPAKIARSTPRPSFGLPELPVAIHISRLASKDAAKSLLSTLVSESSGECRFALKEHLAARTGRGRRSGQSHRSRKEVETCGLCHARRAEFSEDWLPGQSMVEGLI